MRLLGLTGGIGSGKSSASALLAESGAVIIDADVIVKELQQPGEPVFDKMVERWGDRILDEDGSLDRPAVAGIVFNDKEELQAIEAMIHPAVRIETEQRIHAAIGTDRTVILDNALIVETAKKAREAKAAGVEPPAAGGSVPPIQAVIVVDCPQELAVERLVAHRGFDRADAEARMRNQVSAEERLAVADFVIDNGSDLESLRREVRRCEEWIATLAHMDVDIAAE